MIIIRSLVLTSGTLKPLSSFAQELDVPFDIQFTGPHVIKDDQILVRVLPKAPRMCIVN